MTKTSAKPSRRDRSPGSVSPAAAPTEHTGRAVLSALLAWLVPGSGHAYLGRWRRGLLFFGLVMFSMALGCYLDGRLFVAIPGQPLSMLGTLASMGMGLPYFVLRYWFEYEGDLVSGTYEYGGAFLLTAGLMNLLVILDTWDISEGRKA